MEKLAFWTVFQKPFSKLTEFWKWLMYFDFVPKFGWFWNSLSYLSYDFSSNLTESSRKY
jgi:hypothetical protein